MDINTLNSQEVATLRELIAASRRIVICGHKSPDGDAVGSSLAWASYLESLGKEVTVCMPDMVPDAISWLPGANRILRHDKRPEEVKKAFEEADLMCCLDFAAASRVEAMESILASFQGKVLVIDHHLSPTIKPDLLISRPPLSSTSELVFRLIWQLGGFQSMDKAWATCVYCGMMTDTGGFVYASTRPEIYFIICELLTKGINKDKIYRNVFNNYSVSALRLRAHVIAEKMNVVEQLHASYFTITKEEQKRFSFVKGDLEGLVNEPLRIKGMKLSISIREDTETPNKILLSLRSVDDFPCNKMAAEFFNGGGHLNASGGNLNCSIDEAEQLVLKAILAYEKLLK